MSAHHLPPFLPPPIQPEHVIAIERGSFDSAKMGEHVEFALLERLRIRKMDFVVTFLAESGMVIRHDCANCAIAASEDMAAEVDAGLLATCTLAVASRFRDGDAVVTKGWTFRVLGINGVYISLKPNKNAPHRSE